MNVTIITVFRYWFVIQRLMASLAASKHYVYSYVQCVYVRSETDLS